MLGLRSGDAEDARPPGNGALRPRYPPLCVAGHASGAGEAAASG